MKFNKNKLAMPKNLPENFLIFSGQPLDRKYSENLSSTALKEALIQTIVQFWNPWHWKVLIENTKTIFLWLYIQSSQNHLLSHTCSSYSTTINSRRMLQPSEFYTKYLPYGSSNRSVLQHKCKEMAWILFLFTISAMSCLKHSSEISEHFTSPRQNYHRK